jgi:hypothetical protein
MVIYAICLSMQWTMQLASLWLRCTWDLKLIRLRWRIVRVEYNTWSNRMSSIICAPWSTSLCYQWSTHGKASIWGCNFTGDCCMNLGGLSCALIAHTCILYFVLRLVCLPGSYDNSIISQSCMHKTTAQRKWLPMYWNPNSIVCPTHLTINF